MKQKSIFVCSDCGTESPKWMGKCPGCGAWNTMNEETIVEAPKGGHKATSIVSSAKPKFLYEISTTEDARRSTGFTELDRVLGGGIVRGSLVLLGGDPGIGKSTILLQMCGNLGESCKILYVSGEESPRQIKLRADRLGVHTDRIQIYSETNMTNIIACIYQEKPDILVVDSVQTMFNPDISPAPGSVSQIRDVAATLMRIAKEESIATFLVGHVTKEGSIAGPKILEHIVDSVLYFEGEQQRAYRIIRAIKNRFGSTNEIGVFEMASEGLVEIPNPSLALLSGRPEGEAGSCILCTMEGTRPVLAEVQALAASSSFGNPRRMATGVDLSRTLMLLAVMEKRLGMHISS
ncbi:MAG: DNA repair protein RadA, partial [Clostridia bacterium]|nr:DNA repair protein RadA [Clostridia bacterium]